jgi:hypothetical protein
MSVEDSNEITSILTADPSHFLYTVHVNQLATFIYSCKKDKCLACPECEGGGRLYIDCSIQEAPYTPKRKYNPGPHKPENCSLDDPTDPPPPSPNRFIDIEDHEGAEPHEPTFIEPEWVYVKFHLVNLCTMGVFSFVYWMRNRAFTTDLRQYQRII